MKSLELERMYQNMRPYEVLQAEMQKLHERFPEVVRPRHDLSAVYQPTMPDFLQVDPAKHKYPAQFQAFKT